jgi:predicted DCC family thiol-disulfide oxidoreductase YuxK
MIAVGRGFVKAVQHEPARSGRLGRDVSPCSGSKPAAAYDPSRDPARPGSGIANVDSKGSDVRGKNLDIDGRGIGVGGNGLEVGGGNDSTGSGGDHVAREIRLAPMDALERPVLFYDGRCPFCRAQVQRLVRWCDGRIATETLQNATPGAEIPDEVRLLTRDGYIYGGMDAVVHALRSRSALRPLTAVYFMPGARQAAQAAYRWVSARRYSLGKLSCPDGTCAIHGAAPGREQGDRGK